MSYVKVFFAISSEESDTTEVESLWASPVEGGYKLENIPFYAKGFAMNDVVSTKRIHDLLYVSDLIRPSGHSTVRIWFSRENFVQQARKELKSLGCDSEISDLKRLIAVDIPPYIKYESVKTFLTTGENAGKWEYEEACLGQ